MSRSRPQASIALLLCTAGAGGMLYGYDLGIIGPALPYLGKTLGLTLRQESLVAAAVLGGGMISALIAGALAELIGRKKVMILGAVMFELSIILIVTADRFLPLVLGRTLQGMSAAMVGLTIPIHMAESVPEKIRGRGMAAYQLILTMGVFIAMAVGAHDTRVMEEAARGLASGPKLTELQDHAWRIMFLSAVFPGLVFLGCAAFVGESPRWLARRAEVKRPQGESVFQRKYLLLFLLCCCFTACVHATGINTIVQFVVVIFEGAGVHPLAAANRAGVISGTYVIFTFMGLLFVDRIGRRPLLLLGTAGIVVALVGATLVFARLEGGRIDVTAAMRKRIAGNALRVEVSPSSFAGFPSRAPVQVTVLYAFGSAEQIAVMSSDAPKPVLDLRAPESRGGIPPRLVIRRARLGPVPSPTAGRAVLAMLLLFIASFAAGPGACFWVPIELLPTRVRSMGVGIASLLGSGVSTGLAAVFYPAVGRFGYSSMFLLWAACTFAFFFLVAFFIPETKGRTLEDIESSLG